MGFMDALSNAWNGVKNFVGNIATPVGNAPRGITQIFGQTADVAREEWQRTEQSANEQFKRDLALQAYANEHASIEAEKAWQRTMDADNTKYERAVESMKNAGINPIMALGNIDTSVGMSSPSAGSSSARSGGSNYTGSSSGGHGAGFLAQVVAGLITKGKSKGSTLSQTFNNKGELVRSTITSR